MHVATLRTGLRWIACFLVASSALGVRAQTCATGTAQATLETATLDVALFNTGGLFFGGTRTSGDGYLLPKHGGVSPVFAASFWVGGKVNGELRTAAARYGGYDFWPGPLDDTASLPEDCSAHDRIYTVSRSDVARYLATGRATDDLRDWPVEAGAPVVDGDGVAGNYNLDGGDQPEILGDVNAFWVMNDAGRLRDTTWVAQYGTPPLGIEVRVLAFAFEPLAPNVLSALTFYRYEVINRSAQTIDSLYVSMWADAELGDAGDDHVGTDTLRNLIYVYNDSNVDGSYGEAPPAWGIQVLDGFVGLANERDDDFDGTVDEVDEEMRLSSAPVAPKWNCGSGTGDPSTPEGYANVQRGRFDSGLPLHASGSGCPAFGSAAQAPRTLFAFPGDPVKGEFWTEVNADGQGNPTPQGDRRMVLSTGPGRLAPGESVELVYAMPFRQGSDHLQSVVALRASATVLARLYGQGAFVFRPVERGEYRGGEPELPERQLEISRVRPNPSSPGGAASAVLVMPEEAHTRAVVYDALGRQLAVVVDGELPEGEHALAMPDGLAPGTYLLRVEVAPGAVRAIPFTVAR